MRIGIANDHRAYNHKLELKKLLEEHEVIDFGCFSECFYGYLVTVLVSLFGTV